MTPKEKVSRAVGEPKGAPRSLVESMVTTVNAIEKGREAEKTLRALGNNAPPPQMRDLAALAAVGQLAQNNRLPAGVDVEKLADQMKKLPAFDELTARPVSEIQHDLENGKFTDDLIRAAGSEIREMDLSAAAAPAIDEPELEVPEQKGPLM